jgi:hypothetical protein
LDRKGEDFLALQEYVTQKATLAERLASMEARRDKIKKVIFDKIKADYEGQLRKLVEDFRPVRIRVIQKLTDFETEMAQVEKKLTFANDRVIELRFRHQLGEYAEEEFRRMEYEYLAQVDHVQAQWDDLNADLEDYRSLVGDDKDFQRRYSFQEPASAPALEEVEEEAYPQGPGELTEPEPAAAELAYAAEEAELEESVTAAGAYSYEEPTDYAYAPEPEERTESTQDTALMDDEEIYGRYYADQEIEDGDRTGAVDFAAVEEDESGTLAIPPSLAAQGLAATFSLDDSSTGIWTGDELLPPAAQAALGLTPTAAPPLARQPPAAAASRPPTPPAQAQAKADASFLDWNEEEDDRDSTMVWGAVPVQEPPPPSPPPKVLVFRDRRSNKEVSYPLGKGEVSIGRSQDNDIVLTEGKISRRHAKVQFLDGGFVLSDLNSSNGTFVNGQKIARPVVLRENDEILIGDSGMVFR